MLRDQIDEAHVAILQRSHDETVSMLAELDKRIAQGDPTVRSRINHGSQITQLVSAMYSLGASVEALRATAAPLPSILAKTQDRMFKPATRGSPLEVLLDAAALVVLFEDQEGAQDLVTAVERFEVEDYLIDSYIGSLTEFRQPSDQLQMATLCADLGGERPPLYDGQREAAKLALEGAPEAAAERLARYVSSEWFSSHEKKPVHRVRSFYVGNWCFTAAATAKVFGVDDAALEGHRWYPWDLAHPTGG